MSEIHYGNNKCWVCGKPNINGLGGMRLCEEHKAMDPARPWKVMTDEVERLREALTQSVARTKELIAENAKLETRNSAFQIQADELRNRLRVSRAENAEARADVERVQFIADGERAELTRLRAACDMAEMEVIRLREESSRIDGDRLDIKQRLAWFEGREEVMRRHPLGFIPSGWADWLRENPKPGAGE
jgi:regulator of replication initiation timing